MTHKPLLLLIAVFATMLVASGCGSDDSSDTSTSSTGTQADSADGGGDSQSVEASGDSDGTLCGSIDEPPAGDGDMQWTEEPEVGIDTDGTYAATLETSEGTIVFTMEGSNSPRAVNNFVFLACQGYYNDMIFHRVLDDFMIQTGDPFGDPPGTGGPGYSITDEEFEGDYVPGVVAMARTSAPNSAGSQFFIMDGATPLPPEYQIFGEVSEGLDVVEAIAATPVEAGPSGEPSSPVTPIKVTKVTVATV